MGRNMGEFEAEDRLKYLSAMLDETPPATASAMRLHVDCVAEAVSKYNRVSPETRTIELFLDAFAKCLESRTASLGKVLDRRDVENSYSLFRITAAMVLAQPRVSGPRTAEILDTEEKGSDVNLASYLLLDGFENQYDLAVVISNDSDLVTPIKMVRTRLKKQVGTIDPCNRQSFELKKAASWYRHLRKGPLRASLFPDTLSDTQGPITKPSGW